MLERQKATEADEVLAVVEYDKTRERITRSPKEWADQIGITYGNRWGAPRSNEDQAMGHLEHMIQSLHAYDLTVDEEVMLRAEVMLKNWAVQDHGELAPQAILACTTEV